MVRLTDRPDMTLDVYRGRKTTMQQQQSTIGQLYDKATSAAQMNGGIGEWFRTSRSKARMSSVNHPRQHRSQTDHV